MGTFVLLLLICGQVLSLPQSQNAATDPATGAAGTAGGNPAGDSNANGNGITAGGVGTAGGIEQPPSLVQAVAAAVQSANLVKYVKPKGTNVIKEWTAIGDSYTAGIGSNGPNDRDSASGDCSRYSKGYPPQMNADTRWPGGGSPASSRVFNFGACSGAVLKDVEDKQLSNQPAAPYAKFGHPAVAVISITGNDLEFETAVNSCIIRAHGWPRIEDCNTVLDRIEKKLADLTFLGSIDQLLLKIVIAGRVNRGADPPESFQLYLNGYTPFFNEVDTGCNTVSWEWWWTTKNYLLTTAIRARFNKIVNNLNYELKRSALRLAGEGVFYVDGFQQDYVGHQFCDPAADPNLAKPTSAKTWFWGSYSPWDNTEGPATSPPSLSGTSGATNLTGTLNIVSDLPGVILKALVPDAVSRQKIQNNQEPPSTYNDAFTSKEKFEAALDKLGASPDPGNSLLPEKWRRIFHPKGTPYKVQSDDNLFAIAGNWPPAVASS